MITCRLKIDRNWKLAKKLRKSTQYMSSSFITEARPFGPLLPKIDVLWKRWQRTHFVVALSLLLLYKGIMHCNSRSSEPYFNILWPLIRYDHYSWGQCRKKWHVNVVHAKIGFSYCLGGKIQVSSLGFSTMKSGYFYLPSFFKKFWKGFQLTKMLVEGARIFLYSNEDTKKIVFKI